eukprot:Gb_20914 [translate_table: standard]
MSHKRWCGWPARSPEHRGIGRRTIERQGRVLGGHWEATGDRSSPWEEKQVAPPNKNNPTNYLETQEVEGQGGNSAPKSSKEGNTPTTIEIGEQITIGHEAFTFQVDQGTTTGGGSDGDDLNKGKKRKTRHEEDDPTPN